MCMRRKTPTNLTKAIFGGIPYGFNSGSSAPLPTVTAAFAKESIELLQTEREIEIWTQVM